MLCLKLCFIEVQEVVLYKYFKGVYGGDTNYLKPDKKAYKIVLDKYDASDCVFIGDSLQNDVIAPLNLGMRAIWLTNSFDNNYECISDLEELRNIL